MSSINSNCVVRLTIKCYCNLTSLKIVVHILNNHQTDTGSTSNVITAVKNIFGFWVFLQRQSKSVGLAPS